MAETTVELGQLLTKTNFKLFDFDYKVDDPQFKKEIEQAVTDFFYDYEIGSETPDMFKRKFKTRWLRTIDYYNKLYNTTLLSYNPLVNYSMEEALDQLSQTSNTTDSTTSNKTDSTTDDSSNNHSFTDSTSKSSDYPQQPIAGGDFLAGEINTIADSTSDSTGKSTSKITGSSTGNIIGSGTSNTEYTKTIEGLTGTSYPELIEKHRQSILRISNMVIEELKPCFILVF